jgi:hypothetical protein
VKRPNCKHVCWICMCLACGRLLSLPSNMIKLGIQTSCGCMRGRHKRTHGRSRSPTWMSYASMINRCKYKYAAGYKNYGGRGIRVCKRWIGAGGFSNFVEDVGIRPSINYTLDRINPNGNYEPRNVRWATPREQALNKRKTRRLTYQGRKMTFREWAEWAGILPCTLLARLEAGWSLKRALFQPVRHSGGRKRLT